MNTKNIVTGFFGVIALISVYLASGIKETADWLVYAKPFFAIGIISLAIALTVYNINHIRRVTYPTFICVLAWLYDHKILKSDFSRSTHRVYVFLGHSYKKLYKKVQDAFDHYMITEVST